MPTMAAEGSGVDAAAKDLGMTTMAAEGNGFEFLSDPIDWFTVPVMEGGGYIPSTHPATTGSSRRGQRVQRG